MGLVHFEVQVQSNATKAAQARTFVSNLLKVNFCIFVVKLHSIDYDVIKLMKVDLQK